jgi:hypothetical protein
MAIAFRNKTMVKGTGTSVTGTEPAGTVQNDVLVAFYTTDGVTTSLGVPTGWTSLSSGVSITPQQNYLVCYIVRGASAPSLTFTHVGSIYRELHILGFSGVDTTYPIDEYETVPSTNAVGNNPNPPAAIANSSASMALALGYTFSGSDTGGYGAPSGYSVNSDNTAGNDLVIASKLLSSSGSENPAAFTNTVANSGDNWAATLLLAPSGVGAPTAGHILNTEYESGWAVNTTPKTVTVTVNSTSDVLVVTGVSSNSNTTISTPTGGTGVSWTLEQSDTTANYSGTYVWTATNISPQTFTLSVASGGAGNEYGFSVMKFANAVVGASAKSQSASGAPSVNLLTTQANSAIVVATNDFNASNAAYTWRTNAGALSEQTYAYMSGFMTTYIGVHKDAGAINTYAVGLSAPSNLKYNIIALEIQGTVASPNLIAWITA